jgi:gliding motility-associated-like protein
MNILYIILQKQHKKRDSLSLIFSIAVIFSMLTLTIITPSTLSAQTAVNDYVSTHIESPVTINPTDNDSGCSTYNVNITSSPQHGTTSSIAANGSFTYTPNSGFTGRDSLQYSITCNGNSDIAKVFISVMPFPDNVYNMNCVEIPDSTQWGIMRGDSSTSTAHMYAQPYAGDIDNDGDIEVLAVGHYNSPSYSHSIVIFNSQLVQEISISTPEMYVYGGYPLAIADVDNDGIAEIFVHSTNGVLQCYNYNGTSVTTKWTSSQPCISDRSAILAIADANADGIPDILCINKIYNAVTGVLELTLPATVGQATVYGVGKPTMPVFADMDNDGFLEVVGGSTVIKINISNSNGTIGNSSSIWKTISGSNIGDGFTSIADIDLDGYMDVVVVRTGIMYAWKPYSGIGSTPQLIGSSTFSAVNNSSGSRALVADIDNDGYPEIAWTYALNMRACRYNSATNSINQLWQQSTTDGSGATTMTVFDFNQDGSAEIVYRDETLLRIINGNTGANISTFSCPAPTAVDYPIIVDLNQDGSAEIIVSTCAFISGTVLPARIILFTSSGSSTRWAPARHVWNQHGYNVVHINDDLTVPQYQFNPVTPITDPNTPSVVRRPFNNFLQQTTSIDQYGIPFFTLPDAAAIEDSTSVYSSCDSIRISICYRNEGDNVLSAPYKITVYKDTYRGSVIRTVTVNSNLYPDSSSRISFSFTSADLFPFQPITNFVFALNDSGTGIAQNGNQQTECDTTDNTLILNYEDISGNIEIQIDTGICQGEPYTENGFDIPADSTQVPGTIIHRQLTLVSTGGCDSIIKLELTVYAAYNIEITKEACNFYTWNNETYYDSGDYTQYFTSDNGCDSTVTMHLSIIDANIEIITLTEDFCEEYFSILTANSTTEDILWSTGEISDTITVRRPGNYSVSISLTNCNAEDVITIAPCEFNLYLPNAITPTNQDGLNDYFMLPLSETPQIMEVEIDIYDRWGKLVFTSEEIYFKWDGNVNGVILPNTVFNYRLLVRTQMGKPMMFKGSITVL